MLKLRHLPDAAGVACTRDVLIGKLYDVAKGQFTIQIGDRECEDPDVLLAVKPVLERVCRNRIAAADQALAGYGIDVNE